MITYSFNPSTWEAEFEVILISIVSSRPARNYSDILSQKIKQFLVHSWNHQIEHVKKEQNNECEDAFCKPGVTRAVMCRPLEASEPSQHQLCSPLGQLRWVCRKASLPSVIRFLISQKTTVLPERLASPSWNWKPWEQSLTFWTYWSGFNGLMLLKLPFGFPIKLAAAV